LPANRIFPWIALGAVGIVAVLLLSRLPLLEQSLQERRITVSAFRPENAARLTDDRLVDRISAIPLASGPVRVGWDHSILAVDLKGSDPEKIAGDIGRLLRFAFGDVGNVKQVLVRVIDARKDGRGLLLAAESRREDWAGAEWSERTGANGSDVAPRIGRDDRIRWSITASGKRWLENFAN